MDVDNAAQIAMASLAVGITPIVRVPGKEHFHATRLLDSGAQGIVVPHVDTVEEAERAVAYCKYPPKGHRSAMGTLPQFAYQGVPVGEATKAANEETLVVVMVESPEAIERVEQIAAVPGIDSVLIGTNDLCAEMGIPGDFGNDRVAEAYRAMIAACEKHNKFPGMAGIYNEQIMPRYIDLGARFILSGQDAQFMMAGATARTAFLRKTFPG